jgi:hypothetical protein
MHSGRNDDQSKCELCFIYGIWSRYTTIVHLLDHKPRQPRTFTINKTRYDEGWEISPEHFRSLEAPQNVPLEFSQENPLTQMQFVVQLESDQIGEAYHVLICLLLLNHTNLRARTSISVQVTYNSYPNDERKQESIQKLKDLLKWYQINPSSQRQLPSISKGNATRIIAAAFRAADDQTYNKDGAHPDQAGLYHLIRTSLGLQLANHFKLPESELAPEITYLCPAYAAKYWLNRYFRLTKQFGKSKAQKQGGHVYNCMPKRDDVEMVAVIHVRCTPPSGSQVKRVMDPNNLNHVLDSVKEANSLCLSAEREENRAKHLPRRFTHVLVCFAKEAQPPLKESFSDWQAVVRRLQPL